MSLIEFNLLDSASAAEVARVWADIPVWVETLVAARPFADVDEAASLALAAASHWTEEDLDAALAHHPRIGDRVAGDGAEASASRREQAAMSVASADLAEAMIKANVEYERRFGRVFLIRAAGRTPAEMLAEARRRLGNDPGTEVSEALGQLAEIAVLRLRQHLGGVTDEAVTPTTAPKETR